jgi:sugar O-acyltransferase (sialic acid O-acetyltransferase NeuD family)
MARPRRLAVLGSLDLAQLLAYHAALSGEWSVAGFFDDFRVPGESTPGGPILGPISQVEELYAQGEFEALAVGIGYKHLAFRQHCFERFQGRLPFARVVARGCCIDPSARLGEGCFLLPGCTLDAGVSLGANCVLNTGVVIAHDSSIGASSFLGPGTTVAGFVTVGRRCFLGVGTVLIDSLTLGDDVQTGAGAVVTESLERPGLYLGVPARFTRPPH